MDPAGMTKTEKNMQTAQASTWYTEQFSILERGLNGGAASALHAMRKDALAQFAEQGFPTTRNEEWRFTNLTPLTKLSFTLPDRKPVVSDADIDPFTLPGTTCRLVFVNGRYNAGLSSPVQLPAGIRAESLAEALKRDEATVLGLLGSLAPFKGNAFTALQAAFLTDGAFIDVPAGVALDVPVELLYHRRPGSATGRHPAAEHHPRGKGRTSFRCRNLCGDDRRSVHDQCGLRDHRRG